MTILNQIKITPPGSVKQKHSVRTFVPSFLLRFHEFEPEHFIYSAPSQRFVSKGSRLSLSSPRPLICLRKSQFAAIAVIWFKPCEMQTAGTINTTINTVFGLFVGSFCADCGCVCCCGMQFRVNTLELLFSTQSCCSLMRLVCCLYSETLRVP